MPRFQFTLRGMFWVTFWVAVNAAAWGVDNNSMDHLSLPEIVLFFAMWILPFAALGGLLRRP
jgi:hypothetical protein